MDFGELVFSPVLLSGDLVWVVRQWCFVVEPPFEHFSLPFPAASAVAASDEFQLRVDAAF